MSETPESSPTLKSRLADELRKYAYVSLYLFICFTVLLTYEASQISDNTVSMLTVAIALGKALILGKFILIGEALKPGTRMGAPTLLHRIAWRTLGLLLVLIILKLLEELVVGLVRGESMQTIVNELAGQSWLSLLGPVLVMLLILVPLIAAIELDRVIGLKEVLLGRDNA